MSLIISVFWILTFLEIRFLENGVSFLFPLWVFLCLLCYSCGPHLMKTRVLKNSSLYLGVPYCRSKQRLSYYICWHSWDYFAVAVFTTYHFQQVIVNQVKKLPKIVKICEGIFEVNKGSNSMMLLILSFGLPMIIRIRVFSGWNFWI